MAISRITLTLASNAPPREFRIFKRGVNKTEKGSYLFDNAAARSVMSRFREINNDGMIDLEHLSLDDKAPNYDPDARGSYRIELRQGELWAVDVSWTPDGAARLRNRTQRYFSPTFYYNSETMRITELYNIAICAIPASHDAPALVAASSKVGKQIGSLSLEVKKMDLAKVAAQLGLGEDATLEQILEAIKALQEEPEDVKDDPKGDDDPPKKEEAKDDPKVDEDEEHLSKLPGALQARVMAALSGHETLRKEIADIQKKTASSEIEALIASNTDKIPLKMESWARKQTPDNLRVFLANAISAPRAKTPPTGGNSSADVELTDEDKKVAKLSGLSLDKMRERKKKLAGK